VSLAQRYSRILGEVFGYAEDVESEEQPLLHVVTADGAPQARGDDKLIRVARGDALLDDGDEFKLPSELPNVDDDRWTQFVWCMTCQDVGAVSPSNGVGMFALTPRRLADLGEVERLKRTRSPAGKTIYVAIFVSPMTCEKFLKSPKKQYEVFSRSMRDYAGKLASGDIDKDPTMSLSGALAILSRCGPSGLKTWSSGDRFPATQATYDRVAGVF
jgi:hypothetical protein